MARLLGRIPGRNPEGLRSNVDVYRFPSKPLEGPMCPNSIYFGLNVVPIIGTLGPQGLYCLGTWTLIEFSRAVSARAIFGGSWRGRERERERESHGFGFWGLGFRGLGV